LLLGRETGEDGKCATGTEDPVSAKNVVRTKFIDRNEMPATLQGSLRPEDRCRLPVSLYLSAA
jgi:hypothetical protein